ncbi:hypothetical protein K435DRAFT_793263 [Dendrothele bispora CBS 962.96]|uniref:Uncharacterized protein n=1 Tax=Dendrothele bispora (strain CBS 962.96) TaxID=1314807 RepID=A0A4S8MHB5_DENBC|nr:hypothetical protein K435DRAFT_793263 [Dendrothele bispora CBS 962.96]
MATQTTTETITQQDQPHSSSTPSPDPNHNSGFSTYTPSGYWRRDNQPRQHSESPPRSTFQGEGRTLRSSSAPPEEPKRPSSATGHEGFDTPDAPRIPFAYLPIPEPTRPRIRPHSNYGSEPRNYHSLAEEIRLSSNARRDEPAPIFQGRNPVPESVYGEVPDQGMLTNTMSDPRSPYEHRTPIIVNPDISLRSSEELPSNIAQERSSNTYPRDSNSPRSPHASRFSPGGSIRILGPLRPEDQVTIPSYPNEGNVASSFPYQRSPGYQTQYEEVMGSALGQTQTTPNTPSSHPKRYTTPREALEDVGRQCLAFGRRLGIPGIETMELEDHVRAIRALAEAREIDLPIWVASQLRETELNREINRLYSIVRQPDLTLIVPEDPNLPDPWNLTTKPMPSPMNMGWSWQQLEQQRAFEREREKWREELGMEVRHQAQLMLEQRRRLEEAGREEEELLRDPESIPRPVNPTPRSSTIYPSSSPTSNRTRPEVRIVEPVDEEPIARRWMKNTGQSSKCSGGCGHDPVRECETNRQPSEGVERTEVRDTPPHQTPSQPSLKPGDLRSSGYKYTPFPKARKRLREILEDVEGERMETGNQYAGPESSSRDHETSTSEELLYETPVQPTAHPSRPHSQYSDYVSPGLNSGRNDNSTKPSNFDSPTPTTSTRNSYWKQRNSEQEDTERIRNWENGGRRSRGSNTSQYYSKSATTPQTPFSTTLSGEQTFRLPPEDPSPPPPPPPNDPPRGPPPSPTPPPTPTNEFEAPRVTVTTNTPSLTDRLRSRDEDKSTRDAITRESKLEIRKPNTFDGSNRELWRPFLSDCYRMFSAKPTIYSTEQSRVTYASSWFTGAAARYYQNQVEQEMENGLWIPSLHEWSIFCREFSRLFGLHDEVLHA